MALETDALDVWLNGIKIETESGFTEDGSETIVGTSNDDMHFKCRNRCTTFYALRQKSNNEIFCKCIEQEFSSVTSQVSSVLNGFDVF